MVARSIKAILYIVVMAAMAFGATAAFAQSLGTKLDLAEPGHQREITSLDTGAIYIQPAGPKGGLLFSSWWEPGGSPNDRYVWDSFTLLKTQDITQIDWIGGYDPGYFGSGGPVFDFTVAVYPSTTDGAQPAIQAPLVVYQAGGNASEAPYGKLGGVAMYSYSFKMPAPFTATAKVKYWVQIEAWQHGNPDWGIALSSGGDGTNFFRIQASEDSYIFLQGDAAFILQGK